MINKNQFFIVGAQRSGTTYLYTILDEHPEISMAKPLKPEPKYFLNNNFNESQYYNMYYTQVDKKTKIFGEKSTSYYESEAVAQRIAVNMPLSKIIFILSDPVSRAISNYKFSFENGIETRSIEDVFVNDIQIDTSRYNTSVSPFSYKERGIYYKYLNYYYKYFPKKNIKIIIKEDFTEKIDAIQDLYRFLDVNDNYIPLSLKNKINPSKININNYYLSLAQDALAVFYKKHNQTLKDNFPINITSWGNN